MQYLFGTVNGYSYGLTYTEVGAFTLAEFYEHVIEAQKFISRHTSSQKPSTSR